MSTTDGCPCYGAVPLRAARNRRLWGAPQALLIQIAAHYRFGKNGQGCYASHRRLAELIECRHATVTEALGVLEAEGLIRVVIADGDRRRRSRHVIYNEDDWAAFKPATGRGSREAQARRVDALRQVVSGAEIGTLERTKPEPEIDTVERIKSEAEIGTLERTSSSPIGTLERTDLQAETASNPLINKGREGVAPSRIYSAKQEYISQSSGSPTCNTRAGPAPPTGRGGGGPVTVSRALQLALDGLGERVRG